MPAAFEPTVTMTPSWRGTMRRATARLTWNTPWVLTAKVAAQSSSLNDTTGPTRSTPATWTRTERGPRSRSIRSTAASTAALSLTSATRASARAPRSLNSVTNADRTSAFVSSATIMASRERARATAAPMPCAAPVTRATFVLAPMRLLSALLVTAWAPHSQPAGLDIENGSHYRFLGCLLPWLGTSCQEAVMRRHQAREDPPRRLDPAG